MYQEESYIVWASSDPSSSSSSSSTNSSSTGEDSAYDSSAYDNGGDSYYDYSGGGSYYSGGGGRSLLSSSMTLPSSTCPDPQASSFSANNGNIWITPLDNFTSAFHELEASTDSSYSFDLKPCFSTYLAGHRIFGKLECTSVPSQQPVVVYFMDSDCLTRYKTKGGGDITAKMKDFETLNNGVFAERGKCYACNPDSDNR